MGQNERGDEQEGEKRKQGEEGKEGQQEEKRKRGSWKGTLEMNIARKEKVKSIIKYCFQLFPGFSHLNSGLRTN